MKRSFVLALFAVTLAVDVAAQSSAAEERVLVVKTPKMVLATSGSLVVEGRWRIQGRRNPDFSLARLNSSYISCSKATMMCEETVAELRTPDDGERLGIKSGELLATCHTYRVTEWTDRDLIAISRKPDADLIIRVDLNKEAAERLFRERDDATKFSTYILE